MFDRPLSPHQALERAIDVDALVKAIPTSYTVKGMFISRYLGILGGDYARLEPRLAAPPRGGRFVPFKDYPQADYTRIVAAAAKKRFPEFALSEAVRRVAREDLATFSESMFGKIVLAVIGDAHTTLLRVPAAYHRIAPGPNVHAEDLDSRTTRLTFEGLYGFVEYQLGQIEGIVMSFDRPPVVTIHALATAMFTFDVTHS
jgi:uncharacterized protein (TIGR02265 family)